jgi:hypothetical protein
VRKRSDKFAVIVFAEFTKKPIGLDIGILRMESWRKETEFYSSSRNRIISFHLAPQPDSVLDPGGRDSI